jgi:CubicO group peptidase (beta-lactamase class C family)
MMRRFGGLPLVHQPGERWLYHSGSDILGVLLARASGKPLEALLSERIFGPLGMRDTGFHVPADKLDRVPPCYGNDPGNSGRPVLFDDAGANSRFARPPVFPSGGSGLVSTGDDYLAFCRMLLGNGRAPGGCRVLSRPAVELMTADHLTPGQKAASPFFPNFWDTRGWGFGLSVITRRDELGRSVGAFGWDGGYGTSAYSGPPEGLVGVLLTQRIIDYPEGPAVFQDFWASAYQAIDD